MLAFEVAFLLFLGVVSVVTIAAIGRPLAEAYSEKLKNRYKELPPAAEAQLRARVEQQEIQLLELKDAVADLKVTNEFLLDYLKSSGLDADALQIEREKRAGDPNLIQLPEQAKKNS